MGKYTDERQLVKELVERIKPLDLPQVRVGNYANDLWVPCGCMRRAYYDRTNPTIDSKDWYVTAEHGNYIHEMVVDFLKRAGYWRGDELRGGEPSLNLSFRVDCLVQFPTDEFPVPLEIKSIKRQAMKADGEGKIKYRTLNPDWDKWLQVQKAPLKEHELQLQTYIAMYDRHKVYPYGYLLYFNKNDDEMKLWKVEADLDLIKNIRETLTNLEWCIEQDSEPAQTTDPEMCKFCPYKNRCDLEG